MVSIHFGALCTIGENEPYGGTDSRSAMAEPDAVKPRFRPATRTELRQNLVRPHADVKLSSHAEFLEASTTETLSCFSL